MKTIYFITTNTAKYKGFANRFKSLDIELKQHDAELSELQMMEGKSIIKHKLQQAKKLLPNRNVLVDDRGFYIKALNGFPGPLVKPVLHTIGIHGLLKLIKDSSDRKASFISTIGYYDGQKDHYFFDEEMGQIALTPKGNNLHGWTELLYIFSSTTFLRKTLAELNNEEWNKHIDVQAQNDCIKQLIEFLHK